MPWALSRPHVATKAGTTAEFLRSELRRTSEIMQYSHDVTHKEHTPQRVIQFNRAYTAAQSGPESRSPVEQCERLKPLSPSAGVWEKAPDQQVS